VLGLVLLCVTMASLTPLFLTPTNLSNIGSQIAVTLILALGQTLVIISGGIDLSVGSVMALAGIVFAWASAEADMALVPALASGMATGAGVGLLNGVLITKAHMQPFIATLATLSIARGLALVISDGTSINPIPEPVRRLGNDDLLGTIPYAVVLMLVLWAATALLLGRTHLGRNLYALGGNEEAVRLAGIDVVRLKLLVYVLSGMFASVAGILLAGRLASAQPQAGVTFELDAIAAVVIGGGSLAGGEGGAGQTLVGALILGVLRNGLNLLNVSSFWQQVVIGAVIALAVMTDTLRRRSRR